MSNRVTGAVLSQEELAEIRERAEKGSEGVAEFGLDVLTLRREIVRQDVPKLLAEIERFQEEVMSLENMLIMAHGCMDVVKYECEDEEVSDYLYGGDDE